MPALKPASTLFTSRNPVVDAGGKATFAFSKLLQDWDTKLNNGLNSIGQITQSIPAATTVEGRVEGIGTTLQNIDSAGVVKPGGLPAASDTEQGAVKLAAGSAGNVLGSAAMEDTSAFDAAGSAAAAQAASDPAGSAAAAQAGAEAYASDASNLISGTVDPARLPGISVTIITAKLTLGGLNGSMTFENGALTAQVQAT